MKFIIQWQDIFFKWRVYQTQHGQSSAYRTAQQRAKQTGKKHRIIDGDGNLVDLFFP